MYLCVCMIVDVCVGMCLRDIGLQKELKTISNNQALDTSGLSV